MEAGGPRGKEEPCDIEGHKWPQSWQDEKWYALTIPVSHATSLETEKKGEYSEKDGERGILAVFMLGRNQFF